MKYRSFRLFRQLIVTPTNIIYLDISFSVVSFYLSYRMLFVLPFNSFSILIISYFRIIRLLLFFPFSSSLYFSFHSLLLPLTSLLLPSPCRRWCGWSGFHRHSERNGRCSQCVRRPSSRQRTGTYVRSYIHTYGHSRIRIFIHTYIYTYIHTCASICVLTYVLVLVCMSDSEYV